MIYLDSAAIVKLAHAEAESGALRDWLDQRAELGWVSSVLAEVESFRALARHAPVAGGRLHSVLDLIDLVELDAGIRLTAQAVAPASVRSLDAIHLATALHLGPRLTTFVTYDRRRADAVAAAGLPIAMPTGAGEPR
jgi:predicted nucleic acid-binding protein